jgi:predicted RNase H-like nuclease (RuvC/YqgF family)
MLEQDIKRISEKANAIKESRRSLRRKRISADGARDTIEYWKRHLQERKEAKDWLENELRREQTRCNRLWRTSGYGTARRRLVEAKAPATDALKAVIEAKPTTFEGALALIKFVADRGLYSNVNSLPMGDLNAEVCAPLFRAHDIVEMFGRLLPDPAAALAAVRAEQARRKAA